VLAITATYRLLRLPLPFSYLSHGTGRIGSEESSPRRARPPDSRSPNGCTLPSVQEAVRIPEEDLPLTLPETDNFKPSGKAESPLANIAEWMNYTDPTTGKPLLPCLSCSWHSYIFAAAERCLAFTGGAHDVPAKKCFPKGPHCRVRRW